MSLPDWLGNIETPAFVFDLRTLQKKLFSFARIQNETGAHILYALKPLVYTDALREMCPILSGFAGSSLNEVIIAREILGGKGKGKCLSLTTPAYRPEEIERIGALCDHVVLNSLGQWERFGKRFQAARTQIGLRINPGLSLVGDPRYDPCRPGSKLGVPLPALRAAYDTGTLDGLSGLHLHTNSDALSYDGLKATLAHITPILAPWLSSGTLRWLNLGGGYHLPDDTNRAILYELIAELHDLYNLEIYLEPGAALVREAGFLVASVLDLFESGGETIAVLDTSVNHAPEVFEYQYRPGLLGDDDSHPYPVTLAGATCLAGDLFGTYRFSAPLAIGDKVVFPQMGAYTQPKAHWFNGVGLPNLYTIGKDGRAELRRRYTYVDYRGRLALEDAHTD